MSEETPHVPRRIPQDEQEAIRMALEGRWSEAARLNRQILDREPENVEALTRLGKALTELKQYDEAYAIYGRALEIDPYNRIARKNRERLGEMMRQAQGRPEGATEQEAAREQILPDLFISESGKSAVIPLYAIAPARVLRQMSRGQVVRLEVVEQGIEVKTGDGVRLGRLDPRIGRRLAEFIQIGNRYAAAIADVDERQIKVFIRETRQHPRLVGRLSFPPLGVAGGDIIRPYIRDLGLHLQEILEAGLEEEEEEEEEEEAEEEMEPRVEEAEFLEEEYLEESIEDESEKYKELDEEI